MKRLVALSLALFLIPLSAQQANSDPPEKAPPTRVTPLMQLKLNHSKSILEALALEDYGKMAENARRLRLLSMESGWNVLQTSEYGVQSRDFQRTCDMIAEAAERKDVGRAALGYVAMTVRCVECHSYMRRHRNQQTGSDLK